MGWGGGGDVRDSVRGWSPAAVLRGNAGRGMINYRFLLFYQPLIPRPQFMILLGVKIIYVVLHTQGT